MLRKGSRRRVSGESERDYSWYDQAWDKGYAKGFSDGAEKAQRSGNWNLPEAKPNDGEMVQVLVLPYNRKTVRMCRKRKINWIYTNGVFLSGEELKKDVMDSDDDLEEGEIPDMLLISKHEAVDWNLILLWMSAEVPEWFQEQYKGEGDA